MKKRILSMLLCLCLLVGFMPLQTLAAESIVTGGTWGGIDWTLDADGTLTITPTDKVITDYKHGNKTELYERGQVPCGANLAWTDYYTPWTKADVKKLVIQEGVTSIGTFAFMGLDNLTGEVVIPSTVVYIGQEAIKSTKLNKITFAEGGTGSLTIAQGGLNNNAYLEEIVFPADRPEIHLKAWILNSCDSLTHLFFPANVKSVNGTNNLDYKNFSSSHSAGNHSALTYYCDNLETITFGSEAVKDLYFNWGNPITTIGTKSSYTTPKTAAFAGLTYGTSVQAVADMAKTGETVKLNNDCADNIVLPFSVMFDPNSYEFTGNIVNAPADPTAQNEIVYGAKLSAVGLPDGWMWADTDTVPTVDNAGYTAYYTPADTANYDWTGIEGWNAETNRVERKVAVSVAKADITYTAPTVKSGLIYTGGAQMLVTAGSATGGEMQYAIGSAEQVTGEWSTDVPTGTDIGTYYVWYKVVGDRNHNDKTFETPIAVTIAPNTYIVTYLPGTYGTGTQTTATKTQGVSLTLSGAIFTRTGYTQTGWATTDGDVQVYALGASYTADAPITLYPVWTANTDTAYKVEHWQQNVEQIGYVKVDTDAKTGTTGTETEAAAKTYTGFTAQSFNQVAIAADGGTVVKIYYNRNTYTVTYTDNGVFLSNVTFEDVVYGAKAPTYSGTTNRPGYTFGGWYKDSGLTTIWNFENDTINGPTTIYAKWTEKNAVSITETAQTYTWDGNPKSFAITGTPNNEFTVQYKINDNWTTTAPSAVGAYDVKITRTEDDTYKAYEKMIGGGLVINAATPTVTVPTVEADLVYDGTSQSLIAEGTSENGHWEYSLDGTNYLTTVPAGTDAKTYTVYCNFVPNAGYAGVDPVELSVTITPREVGLDWSALTGEELVYSGTAKALTATATGLADGDSCTVTVELVGDNINAGTFSYKATALSNANYKLPPNISSPEYTITPKTLTITADDKEVYVGNNQPELTYTVEGLVGSDVLITAPTLRTDANMYNAGTYAITFANEAAAGNNYSITYVNGALTVKNHPYSPTITPIYDVKIADDITGGEVSASRKLAYKGTTITITIAPDAGYELAKLIVTDSRGNAVAVTKASDNTYTFKMPASKITVKAAFAVANPFEDVSSDAYYYDAVLWAVKVGITSGTGATTFSPDNPCTRAQMATFLWRAAGSPDPVSKTCIFADVPADAYYATAVQWAYEQGITSGTGATTFSPNDPCTRGQVVTFLYRYYVK